MATPAFSITERSGHSDTKQAPDLAFYLVGGLFYYRAAHGNRTRDLRFTRASLCLLS